jgi:hypothetical protein
VAETAQDRTLLISPLYAFSFRTRALIVLAVVALSILPLLSVTHLPLVDYPNHLARYQIYQNLASSEFLRRFYEFHWAYIPNLAQDLIVIPFAQILPIEPAARIATIARITTPLRT